MKLPARALEIDTDENVEITFMEKHGKHVYVYYYDSFGMINEREFNSFKEVFETFKF